MATSSPLSFLDKFTGTVSVLGGAGMLHPLYLFHTVRGVRRWGESIAAGFAASATRRPQDVAVLDDAGSVTFAELDRRTNAISNGLAAVGVGPRDGVGILCRNHRGFIEATVATLKRGADALFLNTGFAGPQLSEVLDREGAKAVVCDEEFLPMVVEFAGNRPILVAWNEARPEHPTLDELARAHDDSEPTPPEKPGRTTILTSGTTGTPKGARREKQSAGLDSLAGILERMPLQVGDRTVIAAPTFHAWGLAHLLLASTLSATIVMRRKFDPEGTLEAIAATRATVLAVVPVMMQRMLALDPEVTRRYDTSSLRVVAASGSALPGELALRWMDRFGDNLHNFYGSTEVAQASIATPQDLRAAPGTAGRPPRGTVVKILDENGEVVPAGKTGRIFVGNAALFEGYTGGGGKQMIDGLMSIGDVGRVDDEGRLFVEGRDDDMIISGGENVFPIEIENLLADHPDILEVSVIGVPDDEFGQRLKAFVVTKPGRELSAEQLKDYVKQHLARYKVPREVLFLDEIPRNPTGKVLKRVLRDM